MIEPKDFKETVQRLLFLDQRSLLLVDSGIKLLLARQNMSPETEKEEKHHHAERAVV